MRRTDRFRLGLAALLLALLLPSRDAEAVIPSAFGPIQALLVILPQLLLAFVLGLVALFKPRTYRLLFAYLWAHKGLSVALLGLLVLGLYGIGRLFSTGVGVEKAGSAWSAFRGGPSRRGAGPGESGPRRAPRVGWQVGRSILGGGAAVDSSPAVVGNRVYFGSSVPGLGQASGALHAIDLDSGGRAWSWTGAGELPAPLRAVFSSPAVGDRFLVSGEGYHEDRDCRLVVLDLDPVRTSGGKQPPKLHGWVQTTSHVESSPAIFGGRAYVGAGDDGFYCFDLDSGKVAWRLEGGNYYEIPVGPGAEGLSKLLGQTVAVTGSATRVFTGENPDANIHVLNVTTWRIHRGPLSPAPGGPSPTERIVIGKVVPAGPQQTKDASSIRLEIATSIPDCESSPAVVDGKVIFGSGIGGNAVLCVDATTGAVLWKTPVPHPAFGAPTVVDGKVLIGLGNGIFTRSDPNPAGAVVALALADGKQLWTLPTGDVVLGAVAVDAGRGYAGSRDGSLYVVDVKDGKLLQKAAIGAPIVSSPALTSDAAYFTTNEGKLICLDRASSKVRWSFPLQSIVISSPVAAAGKILVGSSGKGFYAIVEGSAEEEIAAVRPWSGTGGGPERRSWADDKEVPPIPADKDNNCEPKWPATPALSRPVRGPVIACGTRVFVPFENRLAALDAATAKILWEVDTAPVSAMAADASRLYVVDAGGLRARDLSKGQLLWGPVQATGVAADADRLYVPIDGGLACLRASDGATLWSARTGALTGGPAVLHDLIVASTSSALVCLSTEDGAVLWTVAGAPLAAPTVAGGRVFLATSGTKAVVGCRALADGALLWKKDVKQAVIGHAAASDSVVAFPCEESMLILAAGDGKELQLLEVGKAPVPPAITRDLVVMGAEQRIAAFDLNTGEWPWNYKDQDHIGRAVSPPVVVNESVWVGTTSRGLVILGVR